MLVRRRVESDMDIAFGKMVDTQSFYLILANQRSPNFRFFSKCGWPAIEILNFNITDCTVSQYGLNGHFAEPRPQTLRIIRNREATLTLARRTRPLPCKLQPKTMTASHI